MRMHPRLWDGNLRVADCGSVSGGVSEKGKCVSVGAVRTGGQRNRPNLGAWAVRKGGTDNIATGAAA